MKDMDPRPPFVPAPLLGLAKVVIGVVAVLLATIGGLVTFVVAGLDVWHAIELLFRGGESHDEAIVAVVKSVDAILLALVQFLLAAYLWQILDPKESLLDDENAERLEEAKQILCKVVLVILAVRMLGVVIHGNLQWTDLVIPLGIGALSLATTSLQSRSGSRDAN